MSSGVLLDSTLGEICNLVTDGTHDTPKPQSDGYPLIKAKEIAGGIIDFINCDFISETEHLKVISRSKPEKGDTLFTHIGASLGEAAFVNTSREFSIKNIALFKPNPRIINGRYLYYLVISPQFQELAKSARTGSAQPFLSLGHLRSHRVRFHENIDDQKNIAAILSAFDDLIENNLRRIKILEEMAQTLYREWFVKFHFPGHRKVKMVDSPLGKMPEGWAIGKVGDLVKVCSGFAFKSNTFVDFSKYKVVTIKNVKDGVFIDDCDSHVEGIPRNMPEHCLLRTGEILLSLTGNVGRACLVFGDNFLLNQRVAKLLPHKAMNRGFIYFTFRQDEMRTKLELISIGVAQQNLSPILMGNMEGFIPPDHVLIEFADFAEPICEKIISLNLRNRNLRSTRDLLLPKLISGELDVSELDITIPEANA